MRALSQAPIRHLDATGQNLLVCLLDSISPQLRGEGKLGICLFQLLLFMSDAVLSDDHPKLFMALIDSDSLGESRPASNLRVLEVSKALQIGLCQSPR